MASFESINVAGLDQLQRALQQLPQQLAKNVLRGAVAAGARVIRDEARRRAPIYNGPDGSVPRGVIRRAIYAGSSRELTNALQQGYIVNVRSGKKYQALGKKKRNADAFFAPWVEYGHYVVPRRPAGVSIRSQRAKHRTSGGQFVAARPFMRPAFESKKNEAVQVIKDYLAERIPREAERLR